MCKTSRHPTFNYGWGIFMYTDPKNKMCPLEKETQTHLVIPFLTALGWSPEYVAIERKNVDITLFDSIFRSDDTCRFLIEVKTLGAGVEDNAFEQVQGYASIVKKKCDIVVTDGIRYRLYTASSNFCQNYYANLSRLKKDSIELFRKLQKTQECNISNISIRMRCYFIKE